MLQTSESVAELFMPLIRTIVPFCLLLCPFYFDIKLCCLKLLCCCMHSFVVCNSTYLLVNAADESSKLLLNAVCRKMHLNCKRFANYVNNKYEHVDFFQEVRFSV